MNEYDSLGTGGQDSCEGDSGRPLITRTPYGPLSLTGIISFGTVSCDSSLPVIDTDLDRAGNKPSNLTVNTICSGSWVDRKTYKMRPYLKVSNITQVSIPNC